MKVFEKFYSIREVALMLSVSEKWVWERVRRQVFGGVVELDGGDVRIPAAGINAYLDQHPYRPREINGVAARTTGELRRKAALEAETSAAA